MRNKLTALLMCLAMVITLLMPGKTSLVNAEETSTDVTETKSQQYVEAMGSGWNLGNSFDSFNTDYSQDTGETSWGNPVVTRELLHTIREKGYDSIRIPFTVMGRCDDDYNINEDYLSRYEEVVNWALDEGFYVMINLHHDHSYWMMNWQLNEYNPAYQEYTAIWTQLCDTFKDCDDHLMFESINEQNFNDASMDWGIATGVKHTNEINQTLYDLCRNSGGNNATRMLVFPTYTHNEGVSVTSGLADYILGLDDENIIASFHYYSQWVYSSNLGKTRFDEVLWQTDGVDITPKNSVASAFDSVYDNLTSKGIGVVCDEYGLLGFDKSDYGLQNGETLKYLEYINYYAKQKGICLMLWDNGQHMDRYNYVWKNPSFGAMIEASMTERSSYATGLDSIYVNSNTKNDDVSIPLTLNGNTFEGIYNGDTALIEGTDYTYTGETITLKGSYISSIISGEYGKKATLTMKFSAGADWAEYIYYYNTPVLKDATGTTDSFEIPVDFSGTTLEKATSQTGYWSFVSNNTWWQYLEYDYEFTADYSTSTINMLANYLKLVDGKTIDLIFTFYDGTVVTYTITASNGTITGTTTDVQSSVGELTTETPVSSETPSTSDVPVTTETVATSEAPITTETVTTSEAPVTTETVTTSEAPVTTETVITSEVPATTEVPMESASPEVSTESNAPEVNVKTNYTGTVAQTYTITPCDGTAIDLSKLKIRFNYSKSGDTSQSFWCDNAAIQIDSSPYYVAMTQDVIGTFGDGYVEISFNSSYELTQGSLVMGIRFNQSDWSAYSDFEAGSYEVIYDGIVVSTF